MVDGAAGRERPSGSGIGATCWTGARKLPAAGDLGATRDIDCGGVDSAGPAENGCRGVIGVDNDRASISTVITRCRCRLGPRSPRDREQHAEVDAARWWWSDRDRHRRGTRRGLAVFGLVGKAVRAVEARGRLVDEAPSVGIGSERAVRGS